MSIQADGPTGRRGYSQINSQKSKQSKCADRQMSRLTYYPTDKLMILLPEKTNTQCTDAVYL
jgi:hypothetical protein